MALFKLLCVFLCCALAAGFNVDLPSRVVHRGNPESMFGFAVQAHVDGDQRMLLIGAPKADTHRYVNVTRPGAVFRCDPNQPGRCRELVFDPSLGNTVDLYNRQIDQKSNQWFGATLTSTGVNGPIVACAPLYVSYVTAKLNMRDPVGTCFVARSSNTNDVHEFSPCRTSSYGQRKTGVCQAGFGAAVSKDGQRLFMGAPGCFFWQGRTFSIDSNAKFLYFMPKIPDEGQLVSQSLEKNLTLTSTPEANSVYDDSYMGYSVTVGDFAGSGVQGVAVGVPRGQDLKGLVVLYTWDLQNIRNITGPQIGAYFGYSLASGDIDGDGYDDVIVGSPMFTKPKTEGYEHGRIYVIYQGREQAFQKSHWRTGEVSRGRFGLSVASLGDINLDGFGDIAVGAPYGGAEGRGVVYIYHGSELGLGKTYSQAITAEEVSSPPYFTTFGFSLAGGVDLDRNNYTDLIVGAYKSDAVVFFRSRPVVKVTADVRFMGDTKLISLTEKKCKLADGTEVVCAQLMFCLTYDGINVNQQINFRVTLDLDSKLKASKRLFLLERRETTYSEHILLMQGRQECREVTVYLDDEIRDKLTPIEVSMTYELITQYSGDVIPPVLDQTKVNVYTDSLNIQKNCGPDNVCVPDLRMSATSSTFNYVLGSGENVNIDVAIDNAGEDAFEAAYHLQIPNGVTYAKMERLDKDNAEASPIYCSSSNKDASGNSTLKCDLGNPMPSRQSVKFRVILEVDAHVTGLNFYMTSNSTNPEHGTDYDNTQPLSIGVVIRAQLSIIPASDPPELHYNASLYESRSELQEDIKIGPQVIHKYNIKNEGPFSVDEAEIYVMWPYQTHDGDNLMYMLVQPEWVGDMQCDVARHVNPDNLFVHNPYNSPLVKERQAMASSDLYRGVQISRGGGYYGQTYLEGRNKEHTASSNQFSTDSRTSSSSQNFGSTNQYSGSSNQYAGGSNQYTGAINTAAETSNYGNRNNVGANQGVENRHFASGSKFAAEGSYGSTHYTGSQNSYREYGNGFSKEEEEAIRRNVASSVQNAGIAHDTQGSTQGVYRQGAFGGRQGQSDGSITRQWNRTIFYDSEGNIVSQAETSTEYGTLGREGEAGSSFRNRYGVDANRQSSQQTNQYGGRQNQGQWQHSYSSGAGGQGHTWSTEETVNKNIMNSGNIGYQYGTKITAVGEDDDEIGGFGAYAAQNQNNQFKYGIADVSGAQTQGHNQAGSYNQAGGYSQSGQIQGNVNNQGGYRKGGYSQSEGSYSASSGGGNSYSSSSSYQSGSFSQSNSREQNTRRRRSDNVDPQLKALLERCEEKYKCAVFRCTIGRLLKGQEVWMALRSRVNSSVLHEISNDRAVKLSTLVATRVTKLPIVGKPKDLTWQTSEAQTIFTPQLEALTSGSIPLWAIILAAIVGALLLLLLIFALYKCGFFKRNRPSDHTERQPLNGRDEHL